MYTLRVYSVSKFPSLQSRTYVADRERMVVIIAEYLVSPRSLLNSICYFLYKASTYRREAWHIS